MARARPSLGLACFAALFASQGEGVRVEYEVSYEPGETAPHVAVEAAVSGLDPERRDVRARLEDWGERTEVGDDYLSSVSGDPPVARVGKDFTFALPENWDGTLRLRYRLALTDRDSDRQRSKPLLPTRGASYWIGFSSNTIVRFLVGGESLAAERTIRFRAPSGWKVATGWGGVTDETQVVSLSRDGENVHLAMGLPAEFAAARDERSTYEVIQVGEARDVTGAVLRAARALGPSYAQATGKNLDGPIRVFVNDYEHGGTSTDRDVGLGFTPRQSEAGEENSPRWIHTLAHELFHQWLGNLIRPPESMIWFHEGFTDYVSLWHAAKTGLVPRAWFAQRLAEIDAAARRSAAYGKTSFADPSVHWRDGDGPYEALAYRGGAIVAFHLDLAIRETGRRGVGALLGDWIAKGVPHPDVEALRRWLQDAELGGFFARVVRDGVLPDLGPALARIGFVPESAPATLTYVGIQSDGSPFGRILALDPEGPAARAGLEVGDAISGLSPVRPDPPQVSDEVDTPYRWGLELLEPGSPECRISVYRGSEKIRRVLAPRLIEGGIHVRYRLGEDERLAWFFR